AGVLTFIGLIAVLLIPNVLKQMDQAAVTKETADLAAVSNSIVLQVLNGKSIPAETGLAQSVANWTRFPANQISSNNRGYARAFLIDTNGWFGTAGGALPYTQTSSGASVAPTNARILVVGTIANALQVITGKPGNAAFNAIWNAPAGTTPSTWTTWSGKGQD